MDILSTLFNLQSRKIGVLIPAVVVSEKHSDTLEITEHPVETGAAITDHAYKRPSEVVMEVGFAGGGSLLDMVDTRNIGLSTPLSDMGPKEIYAQLLSMQREKKLIDVTTGKRIYKNMLIRALEVTTDRTTENVLSATVTLREVIITQTKSIKVADKADMKYGVDTAPTQNAGTKSTIPGDDASFLQKLSWWLNK